MSLDYYRDNLYELGRTGGALGCGTLVCFAGALTFLFTGFLIVSAWTLGFGGLLLVVALLAMFQALFNVSIFLIDADTRAFVIRRYLWRNLDDELTFALDELEGFEIEKCTDERRVASAEGELTRIVARMRGGNAVPLNAAFSTDNLAPTADSLNARLREVRQKIHSRQSEAD